MAPPLAAASLLMACAAGAPVTAQARPFWGELEPGPHGVGFEWIWEVDQSRIWPRSPALDSVSGGVGRPVRIDVWYPAECAPGERATLRHYVEMEGPEGPAFEDLVFLTRRWDEYSYRGLADDSASYDRLLDAPTAACPGATPTDGRYPLVVYSAGWFNRAPDNTVLLEYLTSHGFVVATVPQLNPGLWTFDFESDPASVENQIRDLEVAIGVLTRDPRVDRRRVAAMGYSTGGDVALLLQGRSPLVDVVVGLDASWSLGPGNDVVESPFFEPSAHDAPILAVRRLQTEPGADAVMDTLSHALRVVVGVPSGDHGTFSDDPPQRLFLGGGSHDAAGRHALVARAVGAFLEAALTETPMAIDDGLAKGYREWGLEVRVLEPTPPLEDEEVSR